MRQVNRSDRFECPECGHQMVMHIDSRVRLMHARWTDSPWLVTLTSAISTAVIVAGIWLAFLLMGLA